MLVSANCHRTQSLFGSSGNGGALRDDCVRDYGTYLRLQGHTLSGG